MRTKATKRGGTKERSGGGRRSPGPRLIEGLRDVLNRTESGEIKVDRAVETVASTASYGLVIEAKPTSPAKDPLDDLSREQLRDVIARARGDVMNLKHRMIRIGMEIQGQHTLRAAFTAMIEESNRILDRCRNGMPPARDTEAQL